MFHVNEKYRITNHPILKSSRLDGNNGAFKIPSPESNRTLFCIISDGEGWEHVSVHALSLNGSLKTPNWNEMCFIKDTFWDDEDVVIQYHPKRSEYVNNHPNTLHLWRATNLEIPRPPSILVGIK